MADSIPTTQQLVDYLHTAISENDLLYVHYWLRELEDLGEQGREAIRIGRHSWKQETAMQALLEGDQTTFEGNEKVKKLIFWMLSLVQERSSAKYERIQKLVRSRLQKEDIEVEQNEDELGLLIERAEWLLQSDTEQVADWIDENGLRPPDSTNLTGCGPLPEPTSLPVVRTDSKWKRAVFQPLEEEGPKEEVQEPNEQESSNLFSQNSVLEEDCQEQAVVVDDGESSMRSSSTLTTTSNERLPSPVPTSLSPITNDPSLLSPLPQSRIPANSAHAVRVSSLPRSQELLSRFIETIRETIQAIGERVSIEQKTDQKGKEDGSLVDEGPHLLLQFETRMAARLAVEELKKTCPNPRSIELETDYQDAEEARLEASKRPPPPPPRRPISAPAPSRHYFPKYRYEPRTRPSPYRQEEREPRRERYRSRSPPRRSLPPPPRRRPVSPPRKLKPLPPKPPTVPEKPENAPVVENDDPRFRTFEERHLQNSFASAKVGTLSPKARRLHWNDED
ncbi:hypothetical protein JCM5350_007504 [Sporobolomyces pararoseus]